MQLGGWTAAEIVAEIVAGVGVDLGVGREGADCGGEC